MLFLIGHRGVGKTSLISELVDAVDLDGEISKAVCIDTYFETQGEEAFRELERETLKKILSDKKNKVVALGAGFELDKFDFPEGAVFVWIQRRSDLSGRVFFNRPRLNKEFSPIDEYFSRFSDRQKAYALKKSLSVELQEGAPSHQNLSTLQKIIEGKKIQSSKAYYTVESKGDLKFFSGALELRSDLLSCDDVLEILENYTANKYIFAVRSEVTEEFLEQVLKFKNCLIDLPLEDGKNHPVLLKYKGSDSVFASLHRDLSVKDLDLVRTLKLHLKWAPLIENFDSLKKAIAQIESLDVSFLPRDPKERGRWKWVRESLFCRNKINFFRAGLSDFMDQLTVSDLQFVKDEKWTDKGAVLGENVFLSRSPGFHADFFKENFNSFYSAIPFDRDEFDQENLNFIRRFGYRFLSVTAPFKGMLSVIGAEASFNTVVFSKPENKFLDTDSPALVEMLERLNLGEKVLIWGAGSMGQSVKSIVGTKAEILSVRDYQGGALKGYKSVIWCAGVGAASPVFETAPSLVVDLEYKEQSAARQVAINLGTQYISGDDFFRTQAKVQQAFWLNCTKEN